VSRGTWVPRFFMRFAAAQLPRVCEILPVTTAPAIAGLHFHVGLRPCPPPSNTRPCPTGWRSLPRPSPRPTPRRWGFLWRPARGMRRRRWWVCRISLNTWCSRARPGGPRTTW